MAGEFDGVPIAWGRIFGVWWLVIRRGFAMARLVADFSPALRPWAASPLETRPPSPASRPAAMLLLTSAIAVSGCQSAEPPREIVARESAIQFEHTDFQSGLAKYSVQRHPVTANRVHAAQLFGSDAFGVVVAVITGPSYVVGPAQLEHQVSGLLSEDAQVTWGQSGGAASGLGYTPYRLFRETSHSLSCVGFSQTAGERPDDRGRKGNLVFGYFCRDDSRPMTVGDAEELIGSVRIFSGR
jgi:hypothetical protein